VSRRLDCLDRRARGPDRLADEPAAPIIVAVDPVTHRRDDPAGIAAEVVHVDEFDLC
jgi:hypothetical protein